MDRQIITFRADDQVLVKLTGADLFASNIVSYVDAQFDLGNNWSGFDAVRAVWQSNTKTIATVLDAEGKCAVPAEMMRYPSRVTVNLVGSVAEGVELQERLTTYPVVAFTVDKDAKIYSDETPERTPTLFEQFAGILDVQAVVGEWIEEHPEYVTTVLDNSLTEAKFTDALKLKTIKDYVTPEMYGAKGDGIIDDAEAIQSAINSGKAVLFNEQKVYKIATDINVVDKNTIIDFNNAHLILGATIHFQSTPISLGEIAYTANASVITTDTSCENGIFNIVDNSETVRSSPLGFSSRIKNKYLDTKFGYAVTGQAKYYPHMSVTIKNIGDISNADSSRRTGFDFLGCTVNISNVFVKDYTQLILFYFACCHVTVRDANISSSLRPSSGNYHYGFTFDACSEWLLERVCGKADWHIATTTNGAKGQSLNGVIKNCIFKWYTHSMYSYLEHDGTSFNTKIFDSILDGFISNGATLYRCVVQTGGALAYAVDEEYKQDLIFIECVLYKNSTQIISFVYLSGADDDGYFGDVILRKCKIFYNSSSSFNTCPNDTEYSIMGNRFIIDDCVIPDGALGSILSGNADKAVVYNEVIVQNCDINCLLNSSTDLKCDLIVRNCRFFSADGTTKELMRCKTNDIYVYNCVFEDSATIKARGTDSGALYMFYSKFDKNITVPSSGSAFPYTCVHCTHKDNTPITDVVVS